MLKARKGNRVVRIPDEKANEYKALGYSLFDEKGHVIYLQVKDSERIKGLENEVDVLRRKIAVLKAENAELKAQLLGSNDAEPKAMTEAVKGSQKALRKPTTK